MRKYGYFEMSDKKRSLWARIENNQRPSIHHVIFFTVIAAVMSAMSAGGIGGIFCLSIVGAVFAYFICTLPNFYFLTIIPVSFGVGFAVSTSVYVALSNLLFVPIGLVLAIMVLTKKNLSATVGALTVCIAVSFGAILCYFCVQTYGGGIRESLGLFKSDIGAFLRENLLKVGIPTADGGVESLSPELIEELLQSVKMLLPAAAVLACELCAYLAAKLLRFMMGMTGTMDVFGGRPWAVTLSLPAAVVYVLAFFVGMFVPMGNPVVVYSVLNIMLIIMPAAAITGVKSFLFPGGNLKRRSPIFLIIMGILFLLSPVMVLEMLALFSAIGTIIGAWIIRKSKKS